jgi:hypothetical protein
LAHVVEYITVIIILTILEFYYLCLDFGKNAGSSSISLNENRPPLAFSHFDNTYIQRLSDNGEAVRDEEGYFIFYDIEGKNIIFVIYIQAAP